MSLERMGLVRAGEPVVLTPLSGGVSSDIFRAEIGQRSVCVKRALPKLKVSAEWVAPTARNRFEAEWMRVVNDIAPLAVPALLGEDRDGGAFAMAWLPPERYPVWKNELRDGRIDIGTAAAVGDVLGRIHAATAKRAAIAARFDSDAIFDAIRLEPYLLTTARRHPQLASTLVALADTTRANKRVLVHGDFSPKNVLIGAEGPVILDAECAWYGDPVFDVAFVLNHLLLKGAWRPQWRRRYVDAFDALERAYVAHAQWEPQDALRARVAALLPALMLARVDGKSPVEYLEPAQAHAVRSFASAYVAAPPQAPTEIARRWAESAVS